MIDEPFLTKEELNLKLEVREFVKNDVSCELVKKMDKDEVIYPVDYIKEFGKSRLLGLRFPAAYGGRAMNWTGEAVAIEEVGVLGTALGCAYVMPSIVGEAIYNFGNEEQKEKFLKPMLEGKLISAEALTEPRGGSDFFGARTTAKEEGDHFIIRGQKRFVVGAKGADFFIVYCNTNPNGAPHQRLSLIIVESDREGVETKYLYGLMGTRGGGTGRILFRDVKVPKSNVIGELNSGAIIFNSMMIPERLTSAAASLGMARACLEVAVRYSDRRKAFGKKIREFQGVNFKIADAITKLDAARALTFNAAKASDLKLSSARRLVSEAKRFATDMAWDVCNIAMQTAGGIGYTDILPIEKMVRDSRLIQIWTGTNEIMNMLIQHEYYKEVLKGENLGRMIEQDAHQCAMANDELIFDDDEMWTKGW